jgi:hypothetical protein
MPKRPTDKKGFPRKPEDCFASRHLSASDYKVYDVMVACARAGRISREGRNSTGKLIFNASVRPWLCNAVPISDSHAREILERLEHQGWLKKLNENPVYKNGKRAPDTFEVVEHDAFVADHPNTCPPNGYAPDTETAEAFGLKYGEKIGREEMPANFRRGLLAALLRRLKPTDLSPEQDLTRPEDIAFASALAEIGEAGIRAAFEEAVTGVPVTDEQVPEVKAVPGVPVTDSPRSSAKAVPGVPRKRVPEFREVSLGVSANTTHTPITPEPDGRVGGVLKEKHDDGEAEVAILLRSFVKYNGGEAGQITTKQRQQLKELARQHSREKFRSAALAWLKASPWNNKTTHPYVGFISGFDGYLHVSVHAADQEARRKQLEDNGPAVDRNAVALMFAGSHNGLCGASQRLTPEAEAFRKSLKGRESFKFTKDELDRVMRIVRQNEEHMDNEPAPEPGPDAF